MKKIRVSSKKLGRFIRDVLSKAGVRNNAAISVSEGLVQTSLRGVDSHGVRLFPHYLNGVEKGRINPRPRYKFKRTSQSTGILDADHTFGHAAGMEAAKKAIELAGKAGSGHVAIYNSTHFGAAAYYALEIARHDMIGLSFTNTDALVKTYGGKRAFLGNNPISFSAPLNGEGPFCLDMATSVVTFNKIRQCRESGKPVPPGLGADKYGVETTKAADINMLLPIGEHKGYGLSMMIEILCSLLTGMPYGPYIPKMFEAPMNARRFLGHFVIALNIDCFQKMSVFKRRLTGMVRELRTEPAINKKKPVMVPGDPEKITEAIRKKTGIPMDKDDYERFAAIGIKYGIPLNRQGVEDR